MQEIIGHCILRDYKIEKAMMLTGSGRNGKGKSIEMIGKFLGEDYNRR